MEQKVEQKKNIMNELKLERVVLNIGGTAEKLDKGYKLLETLSGKKPVKVRAKKRIPSWNVRPGLEVGVKVTLRGKEALELLKKLVPAIENTIKEKQIQDNFVSFGIHEYIEIPGVEYIREVGIMGLEVTAVFSKPGKRVEKKKVKRGKAKVKVPAEDIEKWLEQELNINILRRKK